MRHFGMAKIYALANRVPVSAVLSISSEPPSCQLDNSTRIVFINDAFARFLATLAGDLVGKNIEYSPLVTAFDDLFAGFLARMREGLDGAEWRGTRPGERRDYLLLPDGPTALDHGQKGVSVILEDITAAKRLPAAARERRAVPRARRDRSDLNLYDRQGRPGQVREQLCRGDPRAKLPET